MLLAGRVAHRPKLKTLGASSSLASRFPGPTRVQWRRVGDGKSWLGRGQGIKG